MHKLFIALAAVVMASGPAAASDKTDVMAVVHHFVDGFNKGDMKIIEAACADQTSIIDDFAPHEWHGPGACAKWVNDYDAEAKGQAITDGIVTLHKPWHVEVTGNYAYVVTPTTYTYKIKGKPLKETGSVMTMALSKADGGWHITGWAWAQH